MFAVLRAGTIAASDYGTKVTDMQGNQEVSIVRIFKKACRSQMMGCCCCRGTRSQMIDHRMKILRNTLSLVRWLLPPLPPRWLKSGDSERSRAVEPRSPPGPDTMLIPMLRCACECVVDDGASASDAATKRTYCICTSKSASSS
jgi:hypothetical protein